jgi:hypothetical protein
VTLSTASADGWRQRSETVSPGCSGSALASRAMPRPAGWSPLKGAEAKLGLRSAVRRVAGQGDDVLAARLAARPGQVGPRELRRAGGCREREPDEGTDDRAHRVSVMPGNGRPYPLHGYRPAQCAPSS